MIQGWKEEFDEGIKSVQERADSVGRNGDQGEA